MVKMCGASLHLLSGVLLVLNFVVENTAMTTNIGMTTFETIATTVSLLHDTEFNKTTQDLKDNLQNSTDGLTSTTVENTTTPKSDSPTHAPVPEDPQTSTETTKDLYVMVTQTFTTREIQKTTKRKSVPEEPETTTNYGSTYIVILIIIIVCIIGVTIYCCLQKNSRRYSVDLHPKHEDAQIPLSTVDAEVFDATSSKDMQTFSPAESSMPLKDPEPVKEPEKPDGERETADAKQEQSNTQTIVIAGDKVEELTIVDLTDGEMAISTKTSMESLDEPPNENKNNNNIRVKATKNDKWHEFIEISLADLP